MRILALISAVLICAGCGSTRYSAHALFDPSDSPVYFDDRQAQQARIQAFIEGRDEITEMQKINFLLTSMRRSDVTFVRNRQQYSGQMAARWLLRKMRLPKFDPKPITSANDFVHRVANCSSRTGMLYEIILADGTREYSEVVLMHELLALEAGIMAKYENEIRTQEQERVGDALAEQLLQEEVVTFDSGQDSLSPQVLLPVQG